jgi:hypothetical protein
MLSRTLSSLAFLTITVLAGCAAETGMPDGAASEDAFTATDARASSVVGSYVTVETGPDAEMESLVELTLGDDGRYAATFRTAAACPVVDCNIIHEDGAYEVTQGSSRSLSLRSDAGRNRAYKIARSPSGLALKAANGLVTKMRTAQWGGRGLSLRLHRAGATLRFDCAAGSFAQALVVDDNGRFQVGGEFRRGFGVQLPPGSEEPKPEAVTYAGAITGTSMTLSFSLPGQPRQSFALTAGSEGTLFPCL